VETWHHVASLIAVAQVFRSGPAFGMNCVTLLVSNHALIFRYRKMVVVQFESSHLTIATEAWKPASLKAMPPQSNIM
jgi:hypothetical protein